MNPDNIKFLNSLIKIDIHCQDYYELAATKLNLAQEDAILNQDLLIEANRLFAKATQKNPKDFRPYFGLANIFYLLNDNYQAILYLKQAQNLNAGIYDELQEIINYLESSNENNLYEQLNQLTKSLERVGNKDYDEVYEQLKTLLNQLVEQWSHRSQVFITSHDEGIIFQLSELKCLLENTITQVEKQILLIDQEIDIDELEMALRPLQLLFNQCEETYDISLTFNVLSTDIRQLHISILHSIKMIADCSYQANQITDIEEKLNHYLDKSDYISDELDYMQAQHLNIEALEQQFEHMAKYLSVLQDNIDEIS